MMLVSCSMCVWREMARERERERERERGRERERERESTVRCASCWGERRNRDAMTP